MINKINKKLGMLLKTYATLCVEFTILLTWIVGQSLNIRLELVYLKALYLIGYVIIIHNYWKNI